MMKIKFSFSVYSPITNVNQNQRSVLRGKTIEILLEQLTSTGIEIESNETSSYCTSKRGKHCYI